MKLFGKTAKISLMISVFTAAVIITLPGCSNDPAWKKANDALIAEHGISVSERDIPDTGIGGIADAGMQGSLGSAPVIEIAPGVSAKIIWTRGVMAAFVSMEPRAEIQRENLEASERIMLLRKGTIEQLAGNGFEAMRAGAKTTTWTSTPHNDCIYLAAGSDNAVKAGPDGAEFIEVYSPPRPDYIQKAGAAAPSSVKVPALNGTPTAVSGEVFNFHDLQFFPMQSQAKLSRMIGGKNMQLMFKSTDPGHEAEFHSRAEDRLSIVLRGSARDDNPLGSLSLGENDFTYLPATMAHREAAGEKGCDMLTIVWPPNPEYDTKSNQRMAAFNSIIPAAEKVELVHDGETEEPYLNFTEGPAWMDGCLYFSNMWFAEGFASGSPEKSNTIRMNPDGSMDIISRNMQTNGLMPLGNGNLAVCDMFGHRVIEMTPKGRVVRTLADSHEGVRVDGPNDLVIDAKGGIYFTDPQFTPGLDKTQPGRSVFYRKPDGTVIRVIEPGSITLPNGVLLSPDGRTCYINDTRGDIVFAFDVNGDGTLSNRRGFAKLVVPPGQREQEATVTGVDGMTIDENGNLYFATLMGLQIFDSEGVLIGIVHFPIRPVSATFGGDDMQAIFCTCATQIYKIRTNVKGLKYPLGS